MTDAPEAREVLPILFLGVDDRFTANENTRDLQVQGRTHDFRPGLAPKAFPMETQYTQAMRAGRHLDTGPYAPGAVREDKGVDDENRTGAEGDPKVLSALEPVSDSSGGSPTLQPENPETPAPVVKEQNEPPLTPTVI
jgi:hypothetical protein